MNWSNRYWLIHVDGHDSSLAHDMQSPIYLQVLLIGLQAPNVSQLIEESALAAHLTPPTHTHNHPTDRMTPAKVTGEPWLSDL